MSETLVAKRSIYTFTIPAKDQPTFDGRKIETLSMVELTIAEERNASKLAPPDGFLHELAKASIKKMNGQPLSSEEVDTLFAQLRPRQRDLIIEWYRRLNVATKEEAEESFKTASISVE